MSDAYKRFAPYGSVPASLEASSIAGNDQARPRSCPRVRLVRLQNAWLHRATVDERKERLTKLDEELAVTHVTDPKRKTLERQHSFNPNEQRTGVTALCKDVFDCGEDVIHKLAELTISMRKDVGFPIDESEYRKIVTEMARTTAKQDPRGASLHAPDLICSSRYPRGLNPHPVPGSSACCRRAVSAYPRGGKKGHEYTQVTCRGCGRTGSVTECGPRHPQSAYRRPVTPLGC